jgi:hypothetical protein
MMTRLLNWIENREGALFTLGLLAMTVTLPLLMLFLLVMALMGQIESGG